MVMETETTWVKRYVCLRARDEEALDRSIDSFAEALRVHSGSIVTLERPRGTRPERVAKIFYELPLTGVMARMAAARAG